MRVFVTGATGVLGRRVVPQLVGEGHDVTAVARTGSKATALRNQGATPALVDLLDPRAIAKVVTGSDALLHLATAIPSTSRMLRPGAWRATGRLRTEAARNLVDAALALGVTRYVQESLGFVYPDCGDTWINEDAKVDPPRYAAPVLEAEAQTRRITASGGIGIALRFGLFYSADSPQTRAIVDLARRGLLPLPGRHDGYQSWVHVDDAATAVCAALRAPAGPYNVGEDEPLTNATHAETLAELFGRRVHRPPAWLGVGGPLRLQLRSLRVSNRRLRAATGWRAAHPSRRSGWSAVLSRLGMTRSDA